MFRVNDRARIAVDSLCFELFDSNRRAQSERSTIFKFRSTIYTSDRCAFSVRRYKVFFQRTDRSEYCETGQSSTECKSFWTVAYLALPRETESCKITGINARRRKNGRNILEDIVASTRHSSSGGGGGEYSFSTGRETDRRGFPATEFETLRTRGKIEATVYVFIRSDNPFYARKDKLQRK